jgi:hypothetical protein
MKSSFLLQHRIQAVTAQGPGGGFSVKWLDVVSEKVPVLLFIDGPFITRILIMKVHQPGIGILFHRLFQKQSISVSIDTINGSVLHERIRPVSGYLIKGKVPQWSISI